MKFPFDEGKQRGARWNCNLVKRGKETCLSSLFLLFYREEYCIVYRWRTSHRFLPSNWRVRIEKTFGQKLEHEEIIRLILTCDIFAMTFSFATLYSWETTYDFSFFFVDVQMERNNHHPIRSTSMRSFFLFSTPRPVSNEYFSTRGMPSFHWS